MRPMTRSMATVITVVTLATSHLAAQTGQSRRDSLPHGSFRTLASWTS
jgi:hypothetical protein